MELVSQLASVVAPVFLCVGLGLCWAWLRLPFNNSVVTSLVYNVGAPCLILATFAKVDLGPAELAEIAGAALAAYLAFAAIGLAVLKIARLAPSSYLPSLIFPLTGSMGLPVCLFAYGEQGLAFALVYFVLGTVGTFTAGAAIAAGRLSLDILLRSPAVYAVVLAVGLELSDITLPRWAFNTTNLLGQIVIPTQLIALGISLTQLRVASVGRSVSLAALRLGMGVVVGLVVADWFGLTGIARAVVVIQSAMPVAISNYLFAQLYRREPEEVAGMVLVSTAVSFATLPLLLLLVM